MLFKFNSIAFSLGNDRARQILVSGSVNVGEVLVIRGPSGAGKSTLLRVLARLQSCISGEVFLEGKSWLQIPGTLWRASVHYLAQKHVVFDGTVAANLAKPLETRIMNKKIFDIGLAKKIMEQLYLAPNLWDQDARTLSGGEADRLAFIRALLINPQVLLLDEPTAALDEKSREAFYRMLSGWLTGPGRAALLVSHIDDFKLLDKISYLEIEA